MIWTGFRKTFLKYETMLRHDENVVMIVIWFELDMNSISKWNMSPCGIVVIVVIWFELDLESLATAWWNHTGLGLSNWWAYNSCSQQVFNTGPGCSQD